MKKILVLINSRSRSGARARSETVQLLKDQGYEIFEPSAEANVDPNLFIMQHQHEVDCVLIGGGDGSVNAALPALVKTQLPLLVLPLGTANNLARTYQIPSLLSDCCQILKNGRQTQIDLGSVNGVYFVNVAGLGLSTEVNRSVSKNLKKHLGVLAFILTAIRVAFRAKPFHVTIQTEKETVQSKSWQISVCNGRHYGNGLTIAKDATLQDEKLHCLSTEVEKLWQGLKLIPAFLSGRYRYNHEVSLISGAYIKITTSKPMRIDVDGDIKTKTPAEFQVHPKIIRLLVPGGHSEESI